MPVTIEISGIPAPQGSKTAVVRGDRAILIEGGSTTGRLRHADWRAAVTAATLEQVPRRRRFPDDRALTVEVTFRMPRPRRPMQPVPSVKPDLDKLLRATLDGLADGLVFNHDQRVVHIDATKIYATDDAPAGATVVIDHI